MRNHFTLENFRRALRNPRLIRRELLRLGSLPFNCGYGYYTDRRLPKSIDVMGEDWDNLLILDACRYDYFANQHDFDPTPDRVVSPGKMSWEFMKKTFQGKKFHDTIYITSNPFATRLSEDTFFKTLYLIDEWDDEIGTIHPEDVAGAAKRVHAQYPNKRLILHFMQPHRPYLGATAEHLRERVNLVGYRNEGNGLQIWGAIKEGKVTVEEVRAAYSETLEIVLGTVDEFLNEMDGRSVITADHGEMLGERIFPFTSRVWGHSEGFSTPMLRQVPWLEISSEIRRNIVASPPTEAEQELKENEVEERLRVLGYTE